MKKFSGFTLAEVLITLTIIGVISVLTVPSLIGNINNQTNMAKLRKGYAAVNQAVGMQMAENGGNTLDTVSIKKNEVTMQQGIMSIIAKNISGVPLKGNANETRIWKANDGIIYYIDNTAADANGTTMGANTPKPVGYLFIVTKAQGDDVAGAAANTILLDTDGNLVPGKAFKVPYYLDGIAFPTNDTNITLIGTGDVAAAARVINNTIGQGTGS